MSLRDAIVEFEASEKDIDTYLHMLYSKFTGDDSQWNALSDEILNTISCIALPKKLKKSDESQVVCNFSTSESVEVEEIQYFLQMSVSGHILGVIWLLMIGWRLDRSLDFCYGNRIRKKLYNEFSNDVTYSPYLFEPYFKNYESWRDKALDLAKDELKKGEDILISTLDFKRFYYSVDITEDFMTEIHKRCLSSDDDQKTTKLSERINKFVYAVIDKYSSKYRELSSEKAEGNILPIGFLPSNVLANYCLKPFDEGIMNGLNPLYYGRYVDDVLIVEKLHKGSPLHELAKVGNLTEDKVFSYFMVQESRWKGYQNPPVGKALFKIDERENESNTKEVIYTVLEEYTELLGPKTNIQVQSDKTRFFFFKSGQTNALLSCFKENIQKNKSEFRRMPEDEAVFQKDDYSEIYHLKQKGINKFRDVEGVELDKYQLSKYLGKYQRIAALVNDKTESRFAKDVKRIFRSDVIVENYIQWEKIFTIFVVNGYYKALKEFVRAIYSAVDKITHSDTDLQKNMKEQLRIFAKSGLSRAMSLGSTAYISKFEDEFINYRFDSEDGLDLFNELKNMATNYLITRMSDKTLYAILPDILLYGFGEEQGLLMNYTNASEVFEHLSYLKGSSINILDKINYKYYPYMITMYDLSLAEQLLNILDDSMMHPEYSIERIWDLYIKLNYSNSGNYNESSLVRSSKDKNLHDVICVGDDRYNSVSVAVSSIRMDVGNFERLIKGRPNRTYKRYQDISLLVNTAITQKANILILPESCVPFEWLSTLARTSARNKMAIITGVEHICICSKVYNFTAVILPFEQDGFPCSQITFHLKNHYAPDEIQLIKGYGLTPVEASFDGKTHYELYCWNDFWFSLYCCYELASIQDRSLFQSYADALIAVEWNKDVNYYSNILESLSRDLHCFAIQVNSSDYGDSRITQPTQTVRKDIIRTKGGKEPSILVDSLSIKELRDFQIKEYELQKLDKRFKLTPPQFDRCIVMEKIKGTLFEKINKDHLKNFS